MFLPYTPVVFFIECYKSEKRENKFTFFILWIQYKIHKIYLALYILVSVFQMLKIKLVEIPPLLEIWGVHLT